MTINHLQQFNNLQYELRETEQLINQEASQEALIKLVNIITKQNKLIQDILKFT